MSLIHFPRFRSNRIDVQLRELSIDHSIEVAAMGDGQFEVTANLFLKHAISESIGPVSDFRLWTVQERTAVISHYLSHTSDGDKNFEVIGGGAPGRYLDYLDGENDFSIEQCAVGDVGGDQWHVSHVLGAHAVVMESICRTRKDWIFADMAVRMRMDGEVRPDAITESGKYSDWLRERMTVIGAYPSSDFHDLLQAYMRGLAELHHLFHLGFDAAGFAILPRNGGAALPAARFLASECIPDFARSLCQ